jgi:alpha-D-xyloside xylohydrolase
VGDNRRDWVGLEDALDHLFRSARAGYVMIGSDIGGYLDRDDQDLGELIPFSQTNFARWTGVGAMTPFMQLHGRANLTPWNVEVRPEETVELYRYWATLHHELVPFFFSLAEHAYAGGPTILRPIGDEADWPGDYRFEVGEAFLVAPILDETGLRDVELPAGKSYLDWWALGDAAHSGGQTLPQYDATDRRRIPLFLQEGAIVPLDVGSDVTQMGSAASTDALTLLVYPSADEHSFGHYELDDSVTEISASVGRVTLSRLVRPLILRLVDSPAPSAVSADGPLTAHAGRSAFEQAQSGYFYDAPTRSLWVKLQASPDPVEVSVQ